MTKEYESEYDYLRARILQGHDGVKELAHQNAMLVGRARSILTKLLSDDKLSARSRADICSWIDSHDNWWREGPTDESSEDYIALA